MALSQNVKLISLEAGADLSASQFKAVKVGTSANQVVLAGAGENAVGVLYEPAESGRAVAVANGGIVIAWAGGTFAVGDKLAAGAAGSVVLATTGAHVLGVALTAGVNGRQARFMWRPTGILS